MNKEAAGPMVCVIIPTMQRRAFLDETLSCLVKTRFPHDMLEVFVVDGGSTDGSEETVRGYTKGSDIAFRWHSDKALRVSAARNYAIMNTTARYVAFLDDDCITDPGWIGAIIGPLESGQADIAGGTDVAPDDDPFLARCEDIAFSSVIGSGGVRGGSTGIAGFCPMTCNMAMRRDDIRRTGGFNETMKAVEDTDFVYKARSLGMRVVFVPEATVKHRRRADLRAICFHNYIRGYGRPLLARRYRHQPQWAFFVPTLGLLSAAVLGIGGVVWPVAWLVFAACALLYGLLLAVSAIAGYRRLRKISALFVVPFLVAVHHLFYALGTMHGPLTGYKKLRADGAADISDHFGIRTKD